MASEIIKCVGDSSAFPIVNGVLLYIDEYGLSKREYFASLILQGLMSSERVGSNEEFAREAVRVSDILIEELNRESM